MKTFLFGILTGLLLHKGINFYYDYSFNAAFDSAECIKITERFDLSDRFACTYKVMGVKAYLKYILIRPTAQNGIDPLDQDFWSI